METTESKNVVKQSCEVLQGIEQMEQQPLSEEEALKMLGAEAPAAYEIAPGMTVEQIKAEFFDEDALEEQPEQVFRLDSSGHRYYYTFDEDGEPRFYVSVTTLIKQTMPTSPQLIKWIADMGYEESQRYAAERAAYGTFMHAQIQELIINRSYDLDSLRERLKKYIESEKLPGDFISYTDDFKKDLLAFAQFMKDVDLKPLAIELVLTNKEDGYAGALDLAAEFNIEEKGFFGETYKTGAKAGEPKETKRTVRVRGIIDFKSGRKGFFPEHEVQLHAYMKMWNMYFKEKPIDRVFNWSPKDWRGTTPSYNFKDQTASKNAAKLPYLVELAKIEDGKRDNTIVSCNGCIDIEKELTDNIIELSLAEVVKKRKQETPGEAGKGIDTKEIKHATTVADVERIIADNKILYLGGLIEYLPDDIELVVLAADIDNHRHYSIAKDVYKCSDGYIEIFGAYQSFSEQQTWEDINVTCYTDRPTEEDCMVYDAMLEAKKKTKSKKESKKTDKKPSKAVFVASEKESPKEVASVAKEDKKPQKAVKTASKKKSQAVKENKDNTINSLLNADNL